MRAGIAARRRIDFLRRAGFSCSGPAIEVRKFSRSVQHDSFHEPPQGRRSFRPDHFPGLGGRQRAFHRQSLIPTSQLRNDMRLVKHSPVGNRRDGADKLNRRDPDLLPHRDRSDRDRRPVVESPEETFALPWHIHAGRLPKTKCADVVVEFRRSQAQRNLDRPDVARLRQNVRDIQQAKRLMVTDAVPGHVYCSVLAIENLLWPRNSLIERRCQGDELKS